MTKKEIGEWIEKDVTSDIVDLATNAAIKRAFDELTSQYKESNKWNRNMAIAVISVLGVLGAAVLRRFYNLYYQIIYLDQRRHRSE